MSDLKPIVLLSSGTVEKMSRHDMLDWVNSTVHGEYKKIEELCSGVAYCQMMDLLFPNTVGVKKIKFNAKLEHEYLHNLKLFQTAFTKLNLDKSVPIERLMKGKFQDNFEFLQWFKKFFDTYSAGKEDLKVPAALAAAAQNPPKPIRRPVAGAGSRKGSAGKLDTLTTPNNYKPQEQTSISPSSVRVLQETYEQLEQATLAVEQERNVYYNKLTKIEAVIKDSLAKKAYVEWCNRALNVLYLEEKATEAGPAGNQEQI